MLGKIAIFIFCGTANLAYAHPHCHYDLREVDLEREMTFCSMDYAIEGVCCTELEEAALEETYTSAVDGLSPECTEYYKQLLCGVCGSYSGHLYERLADDLGTDDGLTMKNEFCTEFTTTCDGQIDFPKYDGEDYCTMHTGGEEDLFWSYPYELNGIFDAEFTALFPDLADSGKPGMTLAMHQSPDKSMFWMSGKEGMLLRVDVDSLSSSSTVMDLSGGIFYDGSNEEGLLDFAFSPMFDTNSFFYVSWTVKDTVSFLFKGNIPTVTHWEAVGRSKPLDALLELVAPNNSKPRDVLLELVAPNNFNDHHTLLAFALWEHLAT